MRTVHRAPYRVTMNRAFHTLVSSCFEWIDYSTSCFYCGLYRDEYLITAQLLGIFGLFLSLATLQASPTLILTCLSGPICCLTLWMSICCEMQRHSFWIAAFCAFLAGLDGIISWTLALLVPSYEWFWFDRRTDSDSIDMYSLLYCILEFLVWQLMAGLIAAFALWRYPRYTRRPRRSQAVVTSHVTRDDVTLASIDSLSSDDHDEKDVCGEDCERDPPEF